MLKHRTDEIAFYIPAFLNIFNLRYNLIENKLTLTIALSMEAKLERKRRVLSIVSCPDEKGITT
jgi:hypothetical protein